MTDDRSRLPNRRQSDLVNFTHGGRRWTVGASRFADGRLAEIFLSTDKGGAIGDMAADAAILASLALQHGCPLAVIQHAIDGRGGPLAAALAALAEGAP